MLVTFLALDFLLTLALVLLVAKFAFGAPGEASPRAVLDAQAAAWNRGDLDGFMDTYWRSDDLTFFSGDQVTRGWQATLQRYRTKYQGEGKEMGRLEFSELNVSELAAEAALARGRWKLTFKDGKTLNGLFTLLLRKIDGRWRIVHDHTSAGT
jgi:beta-aspartyl-peptidase (threonine type)